MKKTVIILSTLAFITGSCGQSNTKKQVENNGYPIDYDNTQVLDTVYVIEKKGVEYKQEPDKNSETLGIEEYGSRLEVIATCEGWLGIRERVHRKFDRENKVVEQSAWEKVYVPKSALGSFSQIKLVQEDLNIISYSIDKGERQDYENGKELTKYLKVELIDKKLFESKKADTINFLKIDTAEIRKCNGVIELPCTQGNVTFTDIDSGGDNAQLFFYSGQIESLNKYLVEGSYYESYDYIFIDKESGDKIYFVDFPNISPDEKHIIAIYANPYENCADLDLASIDGQEIKPIISVGYKNWMPNLDNEGNYQMFFSSDGYLYATAKHEKAYWTLNGEYNTNVQYIRIRIL